MTQPLKLYIAGPYTAPTEQQRMANVNAAIDAAIAAYRKGHFPFIPHLTHFVDVRAKQSSLPLQWEDYIRWDLVWLNECDAVLCLGGSRGADLELDAAKRLGKRIFSSVDELPPASNTIRDIEAVDTTVVDMVRRRGPERH